MNGTPNVGTAVDGEDLVTVEKSAVEWTDAVTAIEITIRSNGDVPVAFRIEEPLPDGVDADHIGLHPEYNREQWTLSADGRTLRYDDVIEPDGEVVTLYGVRESASADADDFLGEARVVESQPVDVDASQPAGVPVFRGEAGTAADDASFLDLAEEGAGAAGPTREAGPAIADGSERPEEVDTADVFVGGEGPDSDEGVSLPEDHGGDVSLPGDGEDAEASMPVEDEESPEDADEPAGDGAADAEDGEAGEADDGDGRGDGPASTADPDSIASELVSELRHGNVSEAEKRVLRKGLGLDDGKSLEVRLRHLQARMADFSAYADAIEEFIADNGSAQDLVEEFRRDMAALQDDLSGLDEQVGTLADRLDAVEDRQSELADRFDAVESDVAAVADVGETVAALREDVDDLADAHDADVDRIEAEIEETVGAAVESLEAECEALRAEVEAGDEWRDAVTEAFGALPERSGD